MSINIRDIAKKCQVSKSTVSRVLNNDDKVKEATRQKVLKMLAEQKYNPLDHIPSLFRTRTRALGLVLGNNAHESFPFFNRAFTSFRQAAGGSGYECRFYTTEEIDRKLAGTEAGSLPTVDGLIFFAPHGNYDELLERVRARGISCVVVRRKTRVPGVPAVYDDDYAGSRLAYEHLCGLGHTRIGLVGGDRYNYVGDRWQSFRDFLAERGLSEPDARFSRHEDDPVPLSEWAALLVNAQDRPTALVCASDFVAITLIKEFTKLGVRVPEDISVVGYDNDYVAGLFSPSLTTVDIPVGDMISYAVKLMDDRLHGQDNGNVEIKVKNKLMIRESCYALENG